MVAKREASTIPRVLKPLVTIAGCRRPGRCARSSRVSERLRHPVAGERAKLVADVEADVIAFGIDDELGRPRRFARQPLALRRSNQTVAGAEDHQQRTPDLPCAPLERQSLAALVTFLDRLRVRADAKDLLRNLRHFWQHGAPVERAAIGDASLESGFAGCGERRIERAQTLPHDADARPVRSEE